MTDDRGFRVYPVGKATRRMYPVWLFGGAIFGMGLITQLYVIVVHGDGMPLLLLVNLAVIASVILGFVATGKARTTITPDHIEIRTLRRIRHIPWEDIQEIEVGGTRSLRTVMVRDSTGRRRALPHLTSGDVPSFADDVEELRKMWKQRRGPDWSSTPQGNAPPGQ